MECVNFLKAVDLWWFTELPNFAYLGDYFAIMGFDVTDHFQDSVLMDNKILNELWIQN